MPQALFSIYNIGFKRKGTGKWVFAQGEITNESNKDYHTAMFHMSVFDKNILMWAGAIKIMGFRKKQTRPFEVLMEGLGHRAISSISRYEICFESGY